MEEEDRLWVEDRARIFELKEQNASIINERNALESRLSNTNDELTAANAELSRLKSQIERGDAAKENEVNKLKTEIQALNEQNPSLADELTGTMAENSLLQSQLANQQHILKANASSNPVDDQDREVESKRCTSICTPATMISTLQPESVNYVYTAADIPALSAALAQSDTDGPTLLGVARGFCEILSVPNNPPVKEVVDCGVLPHLVQMLTYNTEPKVKLEAAWALTKIATDDFTKAVVDAGAVPNLVILLSSPNADVRLYVAYCLGKIAADCPALKDGALAAGVVGPLIQNIMTPATPSLLKKSVWALANLYHWEPIPKLGLIASAIPALASILKSNDDDAKVEALRALSYITYEKDEEYNQAVLDSGIAPMLIEQLGSKQSSILVRALYTVGNILAENEKRTQTILDAGLIEKMPLLLQSSKVWLWFYVVI